MSLVKWGRKLKTPWRNGITHIVMSPMEFMQRLAPVFDGQMKTELDLEALHGVCTSSAFPMRRSRPRNVCGQCAASWMCFTRPSTTATSNL